MRQANTITVRLKESLDQISKRFVTVVEAHNLGNHKVQDSDDNVTFADVKGKVVRRYVRICPK